jgi:hypothetical protein
MKQTAVEWFMEKIGEKQSNGFYVIDTLQDVQNVFEQAKEMFQKQIEDAWHDGNYRYSGAGDSETYYDETFKNN